MTLATGRPNKDRGPTRSRRHGFTLIEMILVMALLVVAVSMVSPRLSGFIRGRALESEARRVLALTHAARSRAISESMPVLLWLDATVGRYGVERETRGQNGDPLSQEFTVDDNLRIAFDQAGRPFRYFGFRLLQRKPPDFGSPGRRVRFTDDHFEAVRVGCRDRGFDGDCPRRDPAHAQSERDQSNRTHRLFAERLS